MSEEAKKDGDIRYAVVPVAGAEMLTMTYNGDVYVAMRPCVEGIGLHWQNEWRRIMNDPILSSSVINLITEPPHRREVACLPLRLWHGWLFKVNLNTVNERARPTVERLQLEGYQVLHDYWTKGYAANPAFARLDLSERAEAKRGVERYGRLLLRENNPAFRRMLHQLLQQDCAALGIETPALAELGADAPAVPDQVAAFWRGIDLLQAKGIAINHSRRADLLALNLREIRAHFRKEGVGVTIDTALRQGLRLSKAPMFVDHRAVNSTLRHRATSCWLFRHEPAAQLLGISQAA